MPFCPQPWSIHGLDCNLSGNLVVVLAVFESVFSVLSSQLQPYVAVENSIYYYIMNNCKLSKISNVFYHYLGPNINRLVTDRNTK